MANRNLINEIFSDENRRLSLSIYLFFSLSLSFYLFLFQCTKSNTNFRRSLFRSSFLLSELYLCELVFSGCDHHQKTNLKKDSVFSCRFVVFFFFIHSFILLLNPQHYYLLSASSSFICACMRTFRQMYQSVSVVFFIIFFLFMCASRRFDLIPWVPVC